MSKMYCEPINGIGNRLMFMLSALRLSAVYKRELIFVWRPDKDIDCNFYEIFSNIFNFQSYKPDLPLGKSISEYRNIIDFDTQEDIYLKGYHFIFSKLDLEVSKEELTLDHIRYWSKFLFSEVIQKSRPTNYFDFGIHIRRSSILDTQDWSHPRKELLLNGIIQTINSKDREIKDIFLSCNNHEELEYFSNHLSKSFNVTTSSAATFGNDFNSIRSSFSDFFSLLNCESIFRRDISTFSALPAMLNSKEEYLYTEDEKLITRKPLILSGLAL